MRISLAIVLVLSVVRGEVAVADGLTTLDGRVTDVNTGEPVEGALVYIAGASGLEHVITTDRAGRYAVGLRPGGYNLIFAFGRSRTSTHVEITGDDANHVDGRVNALSGEVIVIEDKRPPAVMPKPRNFSPTKAPPYSDAAVLRDAWTKAWMLLEIDERGTVTRFKFLKRPGYDLEAIAEREVFKLRFDPAHDAGGKPMRTWIAWGIEWPSAGWLVTFVGTRSAMPPIVGFPPRSLAAHVPCRGSGPLNLGSIYPVYRDCSEPDMTKAAHEAWVMPKR